MYQLHVLDYVDEFGGTLEDIAYSVGRTLEIGKPNPRTDWRRTYVSRINVTDYSAVVAIYGTPYYAGITDTHVHVFIDPANMDSVELWQWIYPD